MHTLSSRVSALLLLVAWTLVACGCAGRPASLGTTAEGFLRCPADDIETKHERGKGWVAKGCGRGAVFVCPLGGTCMASRPTAQARMDWCARTAGPAWTSTAQAPSAAPSQRIPTMGPSTPAQESPTDVARSKEIIAKRMKQAALSVRACFECALQRAAPSAGPAIAGTIRTKFIIAPSGRVQAANIEGVNRHPPLTACILGVIRGLTFPAPENGGIIVVSYPWVLELVP